MALFLVSYASILNPCYDGNMRTYATTDELKKEGIHDN